VYNSRFEHFTAKPRSGKEQKVRFLKAGVLTAGDQPELYIFEVDGRQVVVALSGGALRAWQNSRRYLSREEKIDVAGCFLLRLLEAERPPAKEHFFIDEEELFRLIESLGFPAESS
jgi:hypothetical protein